MTLSLWMLFVSTGFTLHQHYCEGEQKSFRLFTTAPNCHAQGTSCHQKMESQSSSLEIEEECQSSENTKPCCENKATFLKLDSDLVEISIIENQTIPLSWKTISTARLLDQIIFESYHSLVLLKDYKNIRPPLLRKNLEIQVFVQSFLC